MNELALEISGMSCGHCVGAVKKALAAVPGVTVEQVAIGSATVLFDAQVVDVARIAAAVDEAGFVVLSTR